jgi:GNAT superfamily N-acetyltransferase
MPLRLEERYWAQPSRRAAFKRFLADIHGLDLTPWGAAGYWDDAYTPFSFFDGEEIVASVCLYLLPAWVHGRSTHLVQISGVGTRPAWRRRGLNRELTERALAWAEGRHEGVFLFSDDDARPVYTRLGFTPIEEYVEVLEVRALPEVPPHTPARRLDMDDPDDRARLHAAAERRQPVSDELAFDSPRLLMFHALGPLRRAIYELPDLATFVFAEHRGEVLVLHDVIAATLPTLGELQGRLAGPQTARIELRFAADRLAPGADSSRRPLRGNHPFVRDPFPVTRPVFATTARA